MKEISRSPHWYGWIDRYVNENRQMWAEVWIVCTAESDCLLLGWRLTEWLPSSLSSLVAQRLKNPPANAGDAETWVQSPGRGDPLEEEMATHSSILAWENPMERGAWRTAVHRIAKESGTAEPEQDDFLPKSARWRRVGAGDTWCHSGETWARWPRSTSTVINPVGSTRSWCDVIKMALHCRGLPPPNP